MANEILFLLGGLIAGAVILWVVVGRKRPGSGASDNEVMAMMAARLDRMMADMNHRLEQNVSAMNESKSFIASRVSATERTVREVASGLGKLETATAALHKTNQEISAFQQMLKSPKIRGSFGEVLLGNLLGDVLPTDRFELQYTFSDTGETADAIIRLQDGYIVAVDAKFPLANYEALSHADADSQDGLRKQFIRDVKKHITDISSKYIMPQSKTLDFAFMYIPLEGVYYEAIMHDADGNGIWEFCQKHKVIPVSPNSFLAYLHTVLIGLRGMKIEQQAKEILATLAQVRKDFKSFANDFGTIGTHLTNAKNKYEETTRRLNKFSSRLDQIETGTETPKLKEGTG
ncbi:MAG: DNA recombination protein RmuC [Candidatus Sungbacteria bacterium]|nr:DNA recombination protein RmuC [Candidatus Sungbacteria bacterium]